MDYRVVEGISGVWHYHLTDEPKNGSSAKSICGARTMYSGMPIDSWGYKPTHMPTSYCKECERLSGMKHEDKTQCET